MFFSIAWRNAKRSRSENLIYFLTMVTAIATFYIVLSLGEQDVMRFLSELESDAVDRLLTKLLPTVYLCALLFVFSLVIFANKYQLECRSRELGLYLLFGMTKPRLFIQIMAEGLISSLLALLGGLICGGFLSEISSLATARLVGYGIIAHQSSFSIRAVILTTLGFLIIQSVALFVLCGKLFNKEIQQKRRQLREVIFSDLTPQEERQLYTVDKYFQDGNEEAFCAGGLKITAKLLAEALHTLPDEKRQAVLLYYFFNMTDVEIAEAMKIPRSTVQYRRTSSFELLKRYLEERADEWND